MTSLKTWSTDKVPPEEALEYWAAALGSDFTRMDVGARQANQFGGQLVTARSGDMVMGQARASAHDVYRTSANVLDTRRPYLLVTQLNEAWNVHQGGALVHLRPGDVLLLDTAHAFELHFPRTCGCLYIALPRAWAGRWLRQPGAGHPRVAWRDRGWGKALSALCMQLGDDLDTLDAYQGALLSDHLGAMLSAAVEPPDAIPTTLAPRDVVARDEAIMRQRIDQPSFGALQMAQALGISTRTLQRAFTAAGQTFAGRMRSVRLAQAAAMLHQPQLHALPVAEIGARCGYPEPAHFGREFRREHGATPAAWRRAVRLETNAQHPEDAQRRSGAH
jgi:AraC family transcriptional activator of tynA and feaB